MAKIGNAKGSHTATNKSHSGSGARDLNGPSLFQKPERHSALPELFIFA
jgi:hypothetical protein